MMTWSTVFALLFGFSILYASTVDAYAVPFSVPAPWRGKCEIATLQENAQRPSSQRSFVHSCGILLQEHLAIMLVQDATRREPTTSLRIGFPFASGNAPQSLYFPDGSTVTAPALSPVPAIQVGPSLIWKDKGAQAILQRLRTSKTVEVRYRPAFHAVLTKILPQEFYGETLTLAKFREAWNILNTQMHRIPVMAYWGSSQC
jgi:hypothetical protein